MEFFKRFSTIGRKKKKQSEEEEMNLLEKRKGERTPEQSLAAQPKAGWGCSVSGFFAIIVRKASRCLKGREREREREDNKQKG